LSHGALSAHFTVWLAEFLSLNALVELNRKPPDGNTNRNPTMLLPAMLKWISGNAAERASKAHEAPINPAGGPTA